MQNDPENMSLDFVYFIFKLPNSSHSTPSNMDRQIIRNLFRQIICFVEFPDVFFKQSAVLAFFILLWF